MSLKEIGIGCGLAGSVCCAMVGVSVRDRMNDAIMATVSAISMFATSYLICTE
jgi:hypothetical protein